MFAKKDLTATVENLKTKYAEQAAKLQEVDKLKGVLQANLLKLSGAIDITQDMLNKVNEAEKAMEEAKAKRLRKRDQPIDEAAGTTLTNGNGEDKPTAHDAIPEAIQTRLANQAWEKGELVEDENND